MGAASAPRPPGPASHLAVSAAMLATAAALLLLLGQGGPLYTYQAVGMVFRTAEMQASSAGRPGDDAPLPRRHVPAGTPGCPTAQQVAASPWARSCYHVTKACVDQGALVLFGSSDQPKHSGSREAPTFAAEDGYGQFSLVYQNGATQRKYPLASIRGRPAARDEGAAALRAPRFSNCTVPVVFYPFWLTNFGHMLRDNAAKLWGALEETPWAGAIKLVPVTAEGLALPRFAHQLLQPISQLRVESWADFSARLPPGFEDLVLPGPPPSAEGGHQRCFENMLVCTHGIENDRWPLHAYGRHIAETYRYLLPPGVAAAVGTESSIRSGGGGGGRGGSRSSSVIGSSGSAGEGRRSRGVGSGEGRRSGGGGSSSSSSSSEVATVLNVVFQKRSGDRRQLLNVAELLQRCNAWQHTTAAGRRLAAKCWEVEITDLASGLTAALQADVMVGLHGANLANGWLMRPGSSMIEVQAFGFDRHPPHLQDPLFNADDGDSQVLWWLLQGCDPGAWAPSPQEARGKGDPEAWVKNRNVRLRWDALSMALRQVAETGGDMGRYWELWRTGRWWWHVHADSLEYGGDRHDVCSLPSSSM